MSAARKISGKPVEMREADFKRTVNTYTKYPVSMRDEFLEYWTEPNKSGSLMKFEQEKTWDVGRRLARWDRNNFGNKASKTPVIHIETRKPVQNEPPAPKTELQQLEQALSWYKESPAKWTPDAIIRWPYIESCYQAIKSFKLWDPNITRLESEVEKKSGEQNFKAWVILRTFKYYGLTGWTFGDTIEARKKLL